MLDHSQLQLVTQRGVKDQSVFRGESSDTLTIDEWEESMRNFIRKNGVKQENKTEDILIHLRGRTKDVVRVGIRNSEIDVQNNPQAIYELLHKHFSYTRCSSVPIANFNSTMPREQGDPYGQLMRFRKC